MRLRRSSRSFARQSMAIISEAGVMSKPDSWGSPFTAGPRQVIICLRERSLTSRTLRQSISFILKPSSLCW